MERPATSPLVQAVQERVERQTGQSIERFRAVIGREEREHWSRLAAVIAIESLLLLPSRKSFPTGTFIIATALQLTTSSYISKASSREASKRPTFAFFVSLYRTTLSRISSDCCGIRRSENLGNRSAASKIFGIHFLEHRP